MSWILDVLILVIFFGTIINYTGKGFVKSILGFGRTLISAVLTWVFGPTLANVIADRIIGNKIAEKTYNILAAGFEGTAETFDLSQLFKQAPEGFVRLVQRFGGNLADLETKFGNMTAATQQDLVALSDSIAQPITTVISKLFGYLLVFLASYLLFALLAMLLTKIFELPLLKQINRFLGFLLGLAFGVLNTFIFCFFSTYLLPFIAAITATFVAEDLIAGTVLFQAISQFKFF
jgi:uncharacterized membrane protein required for colicin V production